LSLSQASKASTDAFSARIRSRSRHASSCSRLTIGKRIPRTQLVPRRTDRTSPAKRAKSRSKSKKSRWKTVGGFSRGG
jgi:hypothetical protein